MRWSIARTDAASGAVTEDPGTGVGVDGDEVRLPLPFIDRVLQQARRSWFHELQSGSWPALSFETISTD